MKRFLNWINPVNNSSTGNSSSSSSKEVVDDTKKFIESATKHSLVLTDLDGNELVKFKEFLRVGKYEMFTGGTFNYTWTCPQYVKKNVRYEIKLSSNMDLDKIEPPAVNTHIVTLSFIKNGQTEYSFKAETLDHNYNENNLSLISTIVKEIGLDQCICSVRSAWNCLIDFLKISHLLSYESLVYTDLVRHYSADFGVSSSWNESTGRYFITFQSYDKVDLKDVKGFCKNMNKTTPLFSSIEYQNHVLEYSESFLSISGVDFHKSELKFDSKIFYKAIFPIGNPRKDHYYSRQSMGKCPAYISGMIVEVDDRDLNHPSVKFAYSILKKLKLEENERKWVEFVGTYMRGLDLILEKIANWKGNSFQVSCLLKCARQEQVAFSDLLIDISEQ